MVVTLDKRGHILQEITHKGRIMDTGAPSRVETQMNGLHTMDSGSSFLRLCFPAGTQLRVGQGFVGSFAPD
jgi:hypothetical protein